MLRLPTSPPRRSASFLFPFVHPPLVALASGTPIHLTRDPLPVDLPVSAHQEDQGSVPVRRKTPPYPRLPARNLGWEEHQQNSPHVNQSKSAHYSLNMPGSVKAQTASEKRRLPQGEVLTTSGVQGTVKSTTGPPAVLATRRRA
jgi:hypothetical protein